MAGKSAVQWEAQSARATLFSADFEPLRANALYLTAFEQEPSSFQSAPPTAPLSPSVASGFHKLGSPMLQKSQGRLDLVISPIQTGQPKFGEIVALQDLGSSLDLLQKAVGRISAAVKNFARIALIADLFKPGIDSDDATRLISEILPLPIDLSGTADFNLQFSKRRQSTNFSDLTYNIVQRWYVGQVQQIIFQGGAGLATSVPTPATFYIAGYTLDVNTVPEITQIDATRAPPICRELRDCLDMARRSQI